jgi:hypothetical protein
VAQLLNNDQMDLEVESLMTDLGQLLIRVIILEVLVPQHIFHNTIPVYSNALPILQIRSSASIAEASQH